MTQKRVVLTALLCMACIVAATGCAGAKVAYNYKDFTLIPLPSWTNKYAKTDLGDMSYFKMSALVETLNLTRLQAVELQNHFRDLTAGGVPAQNAFTQALDRVRENRFESRLDPEKLKNAPFIVVFDVDETILQQYYTRWKEGSAYYDYKIVFSDGTRGISMAPGWQEIMKTIKKLGGLVVIYSANTDEAVWKIVNTVTIDEQKLDTFVDGILTNNYLILQGKEEWVQSGKPLNNPIVIPAKDLSFMDSTLSKIIIIDDNPIRIIQNLWLRLPKKYQADEYYSKPEAAAVYQQQLLKIAAEIEESAAYAEKNGISFSKAYLPYTQLGQVTLHWLIQSGSYTDDQAIDFIRKNPDIVDKNF